MIRRLMDEVLKWLPFTPTMQVVLLAVEYDTSDEAKREEFFEDFRTRILLTYRSGMKPLQLVSGKEIDSDSGWGCMLRVTQMMLAQCFVELELGRGWRYQEDRDLADGSPYMQVISCFLDVPEAPFSLHNLVATGQRLLGKEPSTWFGPTSAARAAGHLFEAAHRGEDPAVRVPDFLRRVACAVFQDGPIYRAEVLELFSKGASAVIVLVCQRLGLDAFNEEEYREGVESCFRLPEYQGLASGSSGSSAHFFVGTHDDCLLFLDPHRTQPALESLDAVRGPPDPGLHPARPLPLRWARLNPSVCHGFLLRSADAFLALCAALSEGPRAKVFEVLDKRPNYDSKGAQGEDGDMVLLG